MGRSPRLLILLLLWAATAGAFNCLDSNGNPLQDGTIASHFGYDVELSPPRCINGVVTYPGGTAPGTGTISSTGTSVTGTGTAFVDEFNVGYSLTASGQTRDVTSITDDTHLTINAAFAPNASGASFTIRPIFVRLDDNSGGPGTGFPIIELSGSGRFGSGGIPLTYYDYNERVPPVQSSGNGISAPQIMDIIGDPGGDTTDASGKVGGKGAIGDLGGGAGGGAPVGSTPGTGGQYLIHGGDAGRILSGTGGTGGTGGDGVFAGGNAAAAGSGNTCGTPGNARLRGGVRVSSDACSTPVDGKTYLGMSEIAFPDTATTTTNKCIIETSQSGVCLDSRGGESNGVSCTVATQASDCAAGQICGHIPLGWSAVALPTADGAAHKPVETNGSGQLQFSADAMPAADGTSGQYVTTNGSAQLGFTTLPGIPALKELDDTSDQGINSVTEIQVVSGSVTVTSGKRLIIGVSAKLLDSASANRTFTAQVRYDGTACSDATAVADGDGYDSSVASNDRAMMSYFTTLASPSTGAHTFRLCIKSSSATGTQTKEYAQLSFWEF